MGRQHLQKTGGSTSSANNLLAAKDAGALYDHLSVKCFLTVENE